MPELAPDIGFLSVWLLGLSVGLTACTAVCLPFVGTWVVGRAGGGREALRDAAAFALGKVAAYACLGLAAGWAGERLLALLDGGTGHWAIGTASLVAGAWLLTGGPMPRRSCSLREGGADMPPLLLGFALSLTPCAPLAALLAAAALAGDAVLGFGYGAVFGLGAALTPLLVVMPLLGAFGHRLGQGAPWLGRLARIGAGLVLLALGVRRLMMVI